MLPEATAAVQRRGSGRAGRAAADGVQAGWPGFCSGAASCSQSWPDGQQAGHAVRAGSSGSSRSRSPRRRRPRPPRRSGAARSIAASRRTAPRACAPPGRAWRRPAGSAASAVGVRGEQRDGDGGRGREGERFSMRPVLRSLGGPPVGPRQTPCSGRAMRRPNRCCAQMANELLTMRALVVPRAQQRRRRPLSALCSGAPVRIARLQCSRAGTPCSRTPIPTARSSTCRARGRGRSRRRAACPPTR